MKEFIKNRIRTILEGRKTSHTPSNPVGQDPKSATNSDLERTMHKIVSLNNQYGQDPYFQNTHEGDGIYMATIHTNGQITIKSPNTKRKLNDADIGMLWTGSGGNKHVFVKAYRGTEHTDYQNTDADINADKTGTAKTKSPAQDAAIKTYLIFAKDILEYVKQNMEGHDDYTSDTDNQDFTDKTDDKWKYKYDKLEKEKQRQKQKSQISMDPDKASEFEKRQQKLKDKYEKLKQRRG